MATPRKSISRQGQKLPEHVREGIKQMYAIEPNKSLIARTFGVNLSTVYRVLGKEDPEVVREKRHEAMARLAGKIARNVEKLVDDLEPPEDASYMQKATGFGIQVDKLEKLDKRLDEKERLDRVDAGELIALPEDLDSLTGIIRNEIRSLNMLLGVKLDLSRPVEEQIPVASMEIVDAEVTKLSDLDPGASDDPQQERHPVADGEGPS